jgi:Ran GTPase-activating protein 1
MTGAEIHSPLSTADSRVFMIKTELRRFDSREDLDPFLEPLIENPDVEEVHLGGNTYGIEACKYLGEILSTKKKLKVHFRPLNFRA